MCVCVCVCVRVCVYVCVCVCEGKKDVTILIVCSVLLMYRPFL